MTSEFYLTFVLDVFEHMKIDEIKEILNTLETELIIFRVPVGCETKREFILNTARSDKTHITCLTKEEWIKIFKECRYELFFKLNLMTIFDSEGVLSCVFKRK